MICRAGPVFFLGLCCLLTGCGQKAHVSGLVTYEGKPVVKGGLVVFFDADGGSSYERAEIQPDGTYAVTAAPGKKTAVAAANRPYVPPMMGREIPQEELEFPDGAAGNSRPVQLKPGQNKVDLDLRKPPESKLWRPGRGDGTPP